MMRRGFESFGNLERRQRAVLEASEAMALLRTKAAKPGSLLAFGNGRSYGDSCHNNSGALVDMRSHNRILAFDYTTGVLLAESGVLLSDIIKHVRPHGYFPAVVPGTRFVTLGGAIANDIHGKNHHRRGTFGCHVEKLWLLRSDGCEIICTPEKNRELFRATLGGMGLTGLITRASIKLMRVSSTMIAEKLQAFSSLEEYFELAPNADDASEYAVAWIDQLASGKCEGRGVLISGNHASGQITENLSEKTPVSVPFELPVPAVNSFAVRIFNWAYRKAKSRAGSDRIVPPSSFFFPLDAVGHWNRLYGPSGLYQHQCVIPEDEAPTAILKLLRSTRQAGQVSFLTVLKRFGAVPSPGILSFARPGYTLTLDFPNRGAKTRELLSELDRITIEAGGGVNPYKDARMSAETFAASFPHWMELEELRDHAFLSDFWARTALKLPTHHLALSAAE